jgi:hypothetical protein
VHNIIRKNEPNVFLPFPYYCRSLVLAVPIDTSGETSYVQEGDAERDSVWWVLLVLDNQTLGLTTVHSANPILWNSCTLLISRSAEERLGSNNNPKKWKKIIEKDL